MTDFETYMQKLNAKSLVAIAVTLKHIDGLHNQMRHGWRYGANIMRANGLGVPSRERGISYLKKVMARDSRIGMMRTAGDKKFSKIHGLRNQHDEYARRTRTGSRKYNYRKDPNKGKMLTDLDPRGRAMAKTVARNMDKQISRGTGQKWSKKPAQLIDKKGSKTDPANRKFGKRGMANPFKNNMSKDEARSISRGLVRQMRAGKLVKVNASPAKFRPTTDKIRGTVGREKIVRARQVPTPKGTKSPREEKTVRPKEFRKKLPGNVLRARADARVAARVAKTGKELSFSSNLKNILEQKLNAIHEQFTREQ